MTKQDTPYELMPEDFAPPPPNGGELGRPQSPWFLTAEANPGRWVQIGLGEKPTSRFSTIQSGALRRNKKLGTRAWECSQRGDVAYIRYSPQP